MARFKQSSGKQPLAKHLRKRLSTKRNSAKFGETFQSSGASGDVSNLSQNSSQDQSQSPKSPPFTARKHIIHSSRKSILNQNVGPRQFARKSISNQDVVPPHSARKSISAADQSFSEYSSDSDSDSDPFRNRNENIFVRKILSGASTNELNSSKGKATPEQRPGLSGVTKENPSGSTAETATTSKPKKTPVIRKSGHMRPYVPPHATQRRKNGILALQQIRFYQKQTGLLIPKTSFQRLVREVLGEYSNTAYRIQTNTLLALQEACETYLVQTFEKAQLCAIHAKRVTLMQPDFTLVKYLDN